MPWQMDAAGVIAIVIVIVLVPLVVLAADTWRRPAWSLTGRVHLTALSVAILLLGVSLWYWNLLGIHH